MQFGIVAVYCLCADLLVALRHRNDVQRHLIDAEIMTIALVATLFFGGNYALTCLFLREQGSMPGMLSASRFNRRLHRIKDLFLTLFAVLADYQLGQRLSATDPLGKTAQYSYDPLGRLLTITDPLGQVTRPL